MLRFNLHKLSDRLKQSLLVHQKKRKISSKFKIVVGCMCVAIAGAMTVGGIIAYQTDVDELNNTFLIGDVEIECREPSFPTKDTHNGRVDGVPDECELMIPYETISKDPFIKNTGVNDCIVFFRITVPAEIINLVNDDGSRIKNTEEDLFWLKLSGDADEKHENNFDPNWIRLASVDGNIVDCEGVNDEGRGRTYIFGYHQRLVPTQTTETLFDKVQNKKYGSRTIKPDEVEQIKVESFAIQADDVKQAGVNVPTDGELTEETLTYIYEVFVNQNEETVGKGDWRNEE